MRSIFWASRGDLQGAFSVPFKVGAPATAVQEFRSATSRLRGFDPQKFMHDAQPIVKFANLAESETRRFVEEADKMVHVWRESAQPNEQTDSQVAK
jgi:hypothetical protein